MRVFVAGASGAIGTRLVPHLIDRGHEVIGTFRSSPAKAEHLRALRARLIVGKGGVIMGTQTRGASNAKAKRELGWTLRHPSRRQGFVTARYAPTTPAGPHANPRQR